MDKLNFYTVDFGYVKFLKEAEQEERGFSRVPNVDYGKQHKPKFLCGVVLQVNDVDYYVPVTSYTQQKPDNFLIRASNGRVTSSLRFNYMFPVPKELVAVRTISGEPDRAYRALLAQELRYCIVNQEKIRKLAVRTYKRVNLGLDKGLVANSCAFQLLERKCKEYQIEHQQKQATIQPDHQNLTSKGLMAAATQDDPGLRSAMAKLNPVTHTQEQPVTHDEEHEWTH